MSIIGMVIDIFCYRNITKSSQMYYLLATLLTNWLNDTIIYLAFRFNIVFLQPKKC